MAWYPRPQAATGSFLSPCSCCFAVSPLCCSFCISSFLDFASFCCPVRLPIPFSPPRFLSTTPSTSLFPFPSSRHSSSSHLCRASQHSDTAFVFGTKDSSTLSRFFSDAPLPTRLTHQPFRSLVQPSLWETTRPYYCSYGQRFQLAGLSTPPVLRTY